MINKNEILFLQADHVYVQVNTKDRKILDRGSLKNWCEQLSGQQFLQTHRSFVINLDHAKDFTSKHISIGNTVIPISRARRKEVVSAIRKYIGLQTKGIN